MIPLFFSRQRVSSTVGALKTLTSYVRLYCGCLRRRFNPPSEVSPFKYGEVQLNGINCTLSFSRVVPLLGETVMSSL